VSVRVSRLRKSYGAVTALDGVSFEVRPGRIFAYLGPNGAGKTTTINVLCGLRPRDGGEVSVCGRDVARDPVFVKSRIGVVTESSNLYPELKCRRNLEYLGELYGLRAAARRDRAGELLEAFGLGERAEQPFRALSRGLKRRLTIAAALVHRPEVLFLDEPTSGLDVPSARSLRKLIREIAADRTTVFLTTHNLAEAEALADDVAILVKGRIVAEGAVDAIRQRVGSARSLAVEFSGETSEDSLLAACPSVRSASFAGKAWRLEVVDLHGAVAEIAAFAARERLRIKDVASAAPSLEDAFMHILEAGRDGTGATP